MRSSKQTHLLHEEELFDKLISAKFPQRIKTSKREWIRDRFLGYEKSPCVIYYDTPEELLDRLFLLYYVLYETPGYKSDVRPCEVYLQTRPHTPGPELVSYKNATRIGSWARYALACEILRTGKTRKMQIRESPCNSASTMNDPMDLDLISKALIEWKESKQQY